MSQPFILLHTLSRWWSRLARGKKIVVAAGAGVGSVLAVFSAWQDQLCDPGLGGVWVSDACGFIGVGHRPPQRERLSYAAIPEGSCDAIRAHLQKYPDGVTVAGAQALLAAVKFKPQEPPQRVTRPGVGLLWIAGGMMESEAAARRDAAAAARDDHALNPTLCGARTSYETFVKAEPQLVQEALCDKLPDGRHRCRQSYSATCHFDSRPPIEWCPAPPKS